jgi:hypothetical protein
MLKTLKKGIIKGGPSSRYIIKNTNNPHISHVYKNNGSPESRMIPTSLKINAKPISITNALKGTQNSHLRMVQPADLDMTKWSRYAKKLTKFGLNYVGKPVGYVTGKTGKLAYSVAKGTGNIGYKIARGTVGNALVAPIKKYNAYYGTHHGNLVDNLEKRLSSNASNIKKVTNEKLSKLSSKAYEKLTKTKNIAGIKTGGTRRNRLYKKH